MPNNENLDDIALKNAYMQYLKNIPQTPTRPGFGNIYTRAAEGAKQGTGRAILGGLVGLLEGISSPEGLTMLTAATKDPYMKAGLLGQAEKRGAQLDREGATYRSELHPKMQAIGEYVKGRQAMQVAASRAEREMAQKKLEAETLSSEEKFKRETALRKEVNKEIGDFPKVAQSYQRILDVTAEPSAAGDLALIFNFMKILDPGSTVRESEYATAESARADLARVEKEGYYVPAAVKTAVSKMMTGQFLLPEQRQDFITQADNMYQGRKKQYDQLVGFYENLAKSEGLDPNKIFVKRGVIKETYKKGEQKTLKDGRIATYLGKDQWEIIE